MDETLAQKSKRLLAELTPDQREHSLKLTKALLKLPPDRAQKVLADETARRAKIRAAEAKQG